jgi:hypothetical protein
MSDGERRRRFDVLFASYSSDVVAYCSWRAASASDAQDAVAEVFLTAWRRLEELPEGDAALRPRLIQRRRSSTKRFGPRAGDCTARGVDSAPSSRSCRGSHTTCLRGVHEPPSKEDHEHDSELRGPPKGQSARQGGLRGIGRCGRRRSPRSLRYCRSRVGATGIVAAPTAHGHRRRDFGGGCGCRGRTLDTAVTVGANGAVREIAVTWGRSAAWTYTVTYSSLGTGAALVAPANARPLRQR